MHTETGGNPVQATGAVGTVTRGAVVAIVVCDGAPLAVGGLVVLGFVLRLGLGGTVEAKEEEE